MNKRRKQPEPLTSGQKGKGERGLTLVEVLLALSILAAVSTTFLLGMTTSSRSVFINKEHIFAESIARSQMEYVKRQNYRVDLQYDKIALPQEEIDAGYDVDILAEYMNPRGDSIHNDDSLQKITITTIHNGEAEFTLEGYKCFIGQ
jgi:prepilin-type N-terminal cleavage/methylation domain-containing protein